MIRRSSLVIALVTLAACSGGSNNGGGLGQPAGGGGGGGNNGWQQGVFLDWATFYQQCGTVLDQNNFLRSYSDDTYLWYDEITDRDPALFNDPLDYFDVLRTTELSPSGQPKDKFHFTYDSEEWEQLSQSGVSAGFGIQWAFLSLAPPRDLRIAYTEPNSPATNLAEPLARGAQILAIDGVDINDGTQAGVDTLNAGLYPSAVGEQHTFTVRDLGSATTRTVTLTAANITSAPVQNTQIVFYAYRRNRLHDVQRPHRDGRAGADRRGRYTQTRMTVAMVSTISCLICGTTVAASSRSPASLPT